MPHLSTQPSIVAIDMFHRMSRIGINCFAITDQFAMLAAAVKTSPDVAVLTISHTGHTKVTVEATRLAREAGARTICITSYGKSPLQQHADIVLHTAANETLFRNEAMAGRLAELSIADALYVAVAAADMERSVRNLERARHAISYGSV